LRPGGDGTVIPPPPFLLKEQEKARKYLKMTDKQ
jgi:hypothetical protein